MNYLVVKGQDELRIFLPEISTLIIQSTAVAVTTSLLSELINRKIKVIFCDQKANPQSELVGYYECHNSSSKIKEQIEWDSQTMLSVWSKIISEKISGQANILSKYGHEKESDMLKGYIEQIEPGDPTNREGHAAKVYFNSLFGPDFSRSTESFTNACLNYGYSIILSAINREITADGYITQLGIHHINEFNHFNLSCDMMEPFRPIVDDFAASGTLTDENFKSILNKMLSIQATICGKSCILNNAIGIYVHSVFASLRDNSPEKISFVQGYEL